MTSMSAPARRTHVKRQSTGGRFLRGFDTCGGKLMPSGQVGADAACVEFLAPATARRS
jgi:hypothetical protein